MKKRIVYVQLIIVSLVLQSCLGGLNSSIRLESTLQSQQTEIALMQTRNADEIATLVAKPSATPEPLPTNTPLPSPTEQPATATLETLVSTETSEPTSIPLEGDGRGNSTALPTNTPEPAKFQEEIKVVNNSGQDFKINLVCYGGPCQDYSNNSYKNTFPSGTFYFYVYPGRYKITWTICGKTSTFEHALNGRWYILVRTCKK